MYLLIIIVILIFTITFIVIGLAQIKLKKNTKVLSKEITHFSSFYDQSNYKKSIQEHKKTNHIFIDVSTDINNSFNKKIISSSEGQKFISHYTDIYNKAYSLSKKLNTFGIIPPPNILKLISDYEAILTIIQEHNDKVIQYLLHNHKDFFDHCLKYPLDKQQRRSIVTEEDNCLVVSSAGSGKTSSIIGKVKYLTQIKKINPQRILLISYTNKAASELTERISIANLRGYTFHKLAIDIISKSKGIKPSICNNTDSLFIKIFHNLLENEIFKRNILEYYIDYQIDEEEWERSKNKKKEQLSEKKAAQIRTIFPDMDGNTIYVKSKQEQKICFVLSSLGIKFKYEEPYEYNVADEMHAQYKPDFSIYFKQDGEIKRVYLEHFAVDEHSFVPPWFAKDQNMTYEEANMKYNDGISWKKKVHEKYDTMLLTTSSADFHYSDIKKKLKTLLVNAGIPTKEISNDELYNMTLPQKSKQEKAFIRLIATFITLIKSNGKSIESVLQATKTAHDKRSMFMIKNIFTPVYERYIESLNQSGQIDFTDTILQATEICKKEHPTEFDYIIIDEFQDISVDRYNFLKALRDGNPPAKLYCVGDDWQSIYRFSGSDMTLFKEFSKYFGATEINKIETTYRFGDPLLSLSSQFMQQNNTQIPKNIKPFNENVKTELEFYAYERRNYCNTIAKIISSIPSEKSIFLIGRYSFDDYYLSFMYQSMKENNKFYYLINGRKIEFLTIHKSKGLEADYAILLQCNKNTYGFPSLINDDPVLNYVLTQSDESKFGEERRLFYVATTRAKEKTIILYDKQFPSVFVDEFLHPEKITTDSYLKHPNANKRWTKKADNFLLQLHKEGKNIKYIAQKMGRSQTSIAMRLNKLKN